MFQLLALLGGRAFTKPHSTIMRGNFRISICRRNRRWKRELRIIGYNLNKKNYCVVSMGFCFDQTSYLTALPIRLISLCRVRLSLWMEWIHSSTNACTLQGKMRAPTAQRSASMIVTYVFLFINILQQPQNFLMIPCYIFGIFVSIYICDV